MTRDERQCEKSSQQFGGNIYAPEPRILFERPLLKYAKCRPQTFGVFARSYTRGVDSLRREQIERHAQTTSGYIAREGSQEI